MVLNYHKDLADPWFSLRERIKYTQPSLSLPYKKKNLKKGDLGNSGTSMLKINQRGEKGKKGLLLSKSCQASSQSCSFTAFTPLIFYC